MSKEIENKLKKVFPHPRYGAAPHDSGLQIPAGEIKNSYWRYKEETIFPQSVLLADLSRQSGGLGARKYYVDTLKECRACKQPFIFFAKEQKYWYEDLKFNPESDCVMCSDCRKSDQELRRRFKNYSRLISAIDPNLKEFESLIADALFLYEHGLLTDPQKLRTLKNRAVKKLPKRKLTQKIEQLCSELN